MDGKEKAWRYYNALESFDSDIIYMCYYVACQAFFKKFQDKNHPAFSFILRFFDLLHAFLFFGLHFRPGFFFFQPGFMPGFFSFTFGLRLVLAALFPGFLLFLQLPFAQPGRRISFPAGLLTQFPSGRRVLVFYIVPVSKPRIKTDTIVKINNLIGVLFIINLRSNVSITSVKKTRSVSCIRKVKSPKR
jgi:hypothetical protein